jgi:hypothetical protein
MEAAACGLADRDSGGSRAGQAFVLEGRKKIGRGRRALGLLGRGWWSPSGVDWIPMLEAPNRRTWHAQVRLSLSVSNIHWFVLARPFPNPKGRSTGLLRLDLGLDQNLLASFDGESYLTPVASNSGLTRNLFLPIGYTWASQWLLPRTRSSACFLCWDETISRTLFLLLASQLPILSQLLHFIFLFCLFLLTIFMF